MSSLRRSEGYRRELFHAFIRSVYMFLLWSWHRFSDLLFPSALYCLCCGKAVDNSQPYSICHHCMERIGWGYIEIDLNSQSRISGRISGLDRCLSCMRYGLYSRHLILDLKYKGHTYLARTLAEICYERLCGNEDGPEIMDFNFIIPVPMHAEKEKKRGFNQAEKIARHLSRLIGIPELDRVLIRTGETRAQKSISGYERFENLEGAFDVPEEYRPVVEGKSILLLDDIYTTGATAEQCAKTLRKAGASQIIFLSVATGSEFSYGYFDESFNIHRHNALRQKHVDDKETLKK